MNKVDDLTRFCYYYEMFMERAYGTYESSEPGMQASVMQNLMIAEKESNISVESVVRFEKQLIEIKKYMEDALGSYMIKPNIPKNILAELKHYKDQVAWAVSSRELMDIIFNVIDLTAGLRIAMK